ncbi:MAG TPA: hypothetical protein VMZ71_15450, partial [Gemmataceae bacterium]|nr:hypothetical protein [Gemmataceae bacterium]
NQAGPVEEWAHFINVLMLDRHGNRINRRNPQDIFTPLYDKQIPPGAAAVMHYRIDVPATIKGPIDVTAKLRYRKFDYEYMKLVHDGKEPPKLPIVDICEDAMTFPVEGGADVPVQSSPVKPAWQRWNDYGIACFLEGGGKRGHFRQAEAAFLKLLELKVPDAVPHGHLNLARLYLEEGRLNDAATQLDLSGRCDPPAPPWSRTWFTALVNSETATRKEHFDAVIAALEGLLDPKAQPRDRKFDFTLDYVVWNQLANRLFKRAQFESPGSAEQREFLLRAVKAAERVIDLEAEDVTAHDLLKQAYSRLAADLPPWTLGQTEADKVAAWVATAVDRKRPNEERIRECAPASQVLGLVKGPKLAMIRESITKLRAAFHEETDPELKAALAAVLTAFHRESHTIYKPDEIARSNSTRLYREKNPAANYAARDRVIYPTTAAHRDAIVKTGNLPN